uniref:ATPase dynein-related AAA domain-containing protein n=1 Tax=Ditylenchus dipsaci TaxID=166011 RepID=A0A915DGE6_9BILA
MARKKSKRNNIDREVCPIPEKSNKTEKSDDGFLQSRITYSNNVNNLLSTQMLVLVKGPLCSGKTYCAQEVATARKLPMKTLQINDDLDSRTIFGSYSCTDVPGEFVWQPSMFSKCLKEECLILLKSFDTAHVDLVAAILSLAETHSYRVQAKAFVK